MDGAVVRSQQLDLVKARPIQDALNAIDEAMKGQSPKDQLVYCENVLEAVHDAADKVGDVAFKVLDHIESRSLHNVLHQSWAEYARDLERKFPTAVALARSAREKQAYQKAAEKIWDIPLEQLLGRLHPKVVVNKDLGRTASMNLLKLAKMCNEPAKAVLELEKEVQGRCARKPNVHPYLTNMDINGVLLAFEEEEQQTPRSARKSFKRAHNPIKAAERIDGPQKKRLRGSSGQKRTTQDKRRKSVHGSARAVTGALEIRTLDIGAYAGTDRNNNPLTPSTNNDNVERGAHGAGIGDVEEDESGNAGEDQDEGEGEDEDNAEDNARGLPKWQDAPNTESHDKDVDDRNEDAQIDLKEHQPFVVPGLLGLVADEMQRLGVDVPQKTWGKQAIEWVQEILHRLKPARLWVPGKEPGIHCLGGYMTVTREDADVMVLDELSAKEEAARGPEDGKSIFVRCRKNRPQDPLSGHIDRLRKYRVNKISVQDPTQPSDQPSYRNMSPKDILGMLDELSRGEKKVGYGPNEIRPFNLLELASFTTVLPELLTYSDRTQVHSLIRTLNMFPASAVAGMTIWSLLAIHLAVSRPHQDHDGMGTCLTGRKGLKLWIFWPNMTHSQRQQFHVEGPGFCTAEPYYIILAPGDQFIQNPVQSQLVHGVISIGYCGVTKCVGGCVMNEWEECDGLVAMDGMHYWHANFMTDTLRSVIEDLEHENGTNQEPHTDCDELLDAVRILMRQDPSEWGGQKKCVEFEELMKQYSIAKRALRKNLRAKNHS